MRLSLMINIPILSVLRLTETRVHARMAALLCTLMLIKPTVTLLSLLNYLVTTESTITLLDKYLDRKIDRKMDR